jgi:hypothetical protein
MALASLTTLNLVATGVQLIGVGAVLIAVLRHSRGAAVWCGGIGAVFLLASIVWTPMAHLVRSESGPMSASAGSGAVAFLGGAAEGALFGLGLVLVTSAILIGQRRKALQRSHTR